MTQQNTEIAKIESAYSRAFLERSLHRDAVRWRELTAAARRSSGESSEGAKV